MPNTNVDWEPLKQAAFKARAQAYAPYSNFKVGAALLDTEGHVHVGCNVENASYGLTVCAERGAIANAIANGQRRFHALVVTADADEVITPCGACRQVLAEFKPSFPILCVTEAGKELRTSVAELLPHAFVL